jgi:hypothetical protein
VDFVVNSELRKYTRETAAAECTASRVWNAKRGGLVRRIRFSSRRARRLPLPRSRNIVTCSNICFSGSQELKLIDWLPYGGRMLLLTPTLDVQRVLLGEVRMDEKSSAVS